MRARNGGRVAVLLLCMGLYCSWIAALRHATPGPAKTIDFDGVYYGAQCALEGQDPYLHAGLCGAEASAFPAKVKNPKSAGPRSSWEVYLPPALLVVAPLALLPLPVAEVFWIFLTAIALILAALLVWDLGGDAPVVSGCLAVFVLLNCEVLLVIGNPAGITVAFCVISAWCLLERRYAAAGVVLLAVSLVIKPHDAGFIWLYFLLAGGSARKRAIQALVLAAMVGACGVIWITPFSPHWSQELRQNVDLFASKGHRNDPGPTNAYYRSDFSPVISFEAPVSIFENDPAFYGPAAYALGGALILAWAFAVLRKRSTREGSVLALAAISILTILVTYHRSYDAKLLLLTIPACALLWARGGMRRWLGLGLTAAAIFVTSDIPLIILMRCTSDVTFSVATLKGKLTLLALHPAPVMLLVTGCFYLWVYIRYVPPAVTGETTARVDRAIEAKV